MKARSDFGHNNDNKYLTWMNHCDKFIACQSWTTQIWSKDEFIAIVIGKLVFPFVIDQIEFLFPFSGS